MSLLKRAPLQSLKGRLFIFALLLAPLALRADLSSTASASNLTPSSTPILGLSPTAAAEAASGNASSSALSGTSKSLTKSAAVVPWSEDQVVRIHGQRLAYAEDGGLVDASGGVDLESGGIQIHADHLVLDMKSNSMNAEGHVVLCQNGNTIYAQALSLNLKTQIGNTQHVVFREGPWVASGEDAEKTSDTDIALQNAVATSCLRENPHYRLVASEIKVKLGDRIWMYNVVVYIGVVPLLYLWSYSQSLQDPRPPFEIKPGYNQVAGAFVRAAYNFYVNPDEYGSVRLDWMDNLGMGYGLSDNYNYAGEVGSVSAYDSVDPFGNQVWSGSFSHSADLGHGLRLLGSFQDISNYEINQVYDTDVTDNYQFNNYLSLQSGQKDYSWKLAAGETQVLQPDFGADPNGPSKSYVVTTRTLPSFSFTKNTLPLFKDSNLYYGYNLQATRTLIVPQTISSYTPLTSDALVLVTGTAAPVSFTTSLFDLGQSYYNDVIGFTPSLTQNLKFHRGYGLTSNLGFDEGYLKNEGSAADTGPGLFKSTLLVNETFHLPLRRSLMTDLGWHYSQLLSQPGSQIWSGMTLDQGTLSTTWSPSDATNVIATTDYNFLPFQADNDLERLDLIRLQASYSPNVRHSLGLETSYDAHTGEIKTVDSDVTFNGPKKLWEFAAGTSWVNNNILLVPPVVDPNAPAFYGVESPRVTPDAFLLNWRTSFPVTDKWALSVYQRFNVAARDIEEQDYSIDRDLHCWTLDLYLKDQILTGMTVGFALTLKAAPNSISLSSNKLANDLFNDVSFGY